MAAPRRLETAARPVSSQYKEPWFTFTAEAFWKDPKSFSSIWPPVVVAVPVKVFGEMKVIVEPPSRWIERFPVILSLMVLLPLPDMKRKVAAVAELLVIVPAM